MNENTSFTLIFLGLFAAAAFATMQLKECNMAADKLEPTKIAACEKACGTNSLRQYVNGGCVCD
jgi:hypothetical protein